MLLKPELLSHAIVDQTISDVASGGTPSTPFDSEPDYIKALKKMLEDPNETNSQALEATLREHIERWNRSF